MDNGDTGTVKRGRGRPRKAVDPSAEVKEKRGRGRPPGSKNKPKHRGRGRPKGSTSDYTMTSNALMQRRKSAGCIPAETDEERNYNARLIEHIMRINEIASHADRSDLLSLKSCFIAYLQLCQEDGFKVGNMAAYAAMGMNYHKFNLLSKKDDPDIREFCSFVRDTCSMIRETMVTDSRVNPVIGIFWQRNYDGLRNDTEQIQSALEQEEDFESSRTYKDKYKNLIGG